MPTSGPPAYLLACCLPEMVRLCKLNCQRSLVTIVLPLPTWLRSRPLLFPILGVSPDSAPTAETRPDWTLGPHTTATRMCS